MRTSKRFIILGVLIGLLLSVIPVYADRSDVDSVAYVGESHNVIYSICDTANKQVGRDILVYTSADGLLTFSNKEYSELVVSEKRDFMEVALLSTKESNLGTQTKNKVYNFIAEQDTTSSQAVKYLRSNASSDFASAAALLKPFTPGIGMALGVLSLGIFLFIGLSIVLDCAYLTLPLFKSVMDRDDGKRPRFISREAFSATVESEMSVGSGNYREAIGPYIIRRIKAIVLMALALGYLISGQIYDLVAYFVDAFSGYNMF